MQLRCDWCPEEFEVSDDLLRDGETVFDCPQGHATMFTGTPPPRPGPAATVASRMRVYNLTRDIPEEKWLTLVSGQKIKNVAELAAMLDLVEDEVYARHVTADRNDFRDWVRDVFEDHELAAKIPAATDNRDMQLIIYRHLAGHN